MKLSEFACDLIVEAYPILAEGYADLVDSLAANEKLAKLAREMDLDELLDSDDEAIAALKKSNKELVTGFEKEAEKKMRELVEKQFPKHGIVGEEHGYKPGSETRWVFDPVDGTSAMIRFAMADAFDLPQPDGAFGITIGVVKGDEAVVGVVCELIPQEGELLMVNWWVGEKDEPSSHNGEQVRVAANRTPLQDSAIASTVPEVMFKTKKQWSGFQALAESGLGCATDLNCIGYMLLLDNGDIGAAYEADLAYHDAAALVPILQGAGVTVTDEKGSPLSFGEEKIGTEFRLLAAVPALHKEALAIVKQGVPDSENSFKPQLVSQGYSTKFPQGNE